MKRGLEYSNLAIKHAKTPLKALHLIENGSVNISISTRYKLSQETVKCKSMAYWRIRQAPSVLKNGAKYLQTKEANSLTMCLLPHLLTYNKKP